MALTHLSLFSGIAGLDLAASWAGFETFLFVEKDTFCQKVLAKNFPGVRIHDDIHSLTGAIVQDACPTGRVDLISGGFPCQPWSLAGKRKGKEDDRHLWPEMLRVIREVHPRFVVGENVSGFVSMGLDTVLADLEAAGYEATAFVFPAAAVGAWHKRERCFIVAHDANADKYNEAERGEC
ncbi:MAG: DNA cytosine methyltransferase, partial [Thermomicrobia bacterium]|nr:DNA cytosine methyltransferase [Thermomicrobia bacterium]